MPAPRHAVPLTDPADLAATGPLTYEQVAAYLQVSRKTVQRLVAARKLRAVTYIRRSMVLPGDLADFLERHRRGVRRLPTRQP